MLQKERVRFGQWQRHRADTTFFHCDVFYKQLNGRWRKVGGCAHSWGESRLRSQLERNAIKAVRVMVEAGELK